MMGGGGGGVGVGWRSALFTAAQWEELEQQALVYKYLSAGAAVPPELHLAIRRSYEARFFQAAAALGYCSYYGKKIDPEPGRCRRTDGKKWRCSKDAYPDSKYCERHMHRGKNRSRKPVEQQQQQYSQSSSSSSSVTSLTSNTCSMNIDLTAAPFNSIPSYAVANRDYRYLQGAKPDNSGHSFFSETSGIARGFTMDQTLDSAWRSMNSRTSSFPASRAAGNGSLLTTTYTQLQPLQNLGQPLESLISRQQQQHHSFIGSEFGTSDNINVKQESRPLRPFFDEWPKTRDSWPDLDDERSNQNSYLTTQLSISIPMASSDFSTTSSRSPNDKSSDGTNTCSSNRGVSTFRSEQAQSVYRTSPIHAERGLQ